MTIQWATGFEDLPGNTLPETRMIGWDIELINWSGQNDAGFNASGAFFVRNTATPNLRGTCASISLMRNATGSQSVRLVRAVVDNDQLVLGFAFRMSTTAAANSFRFGLYGGIDQIHFGPVLDGGSVWRAGLYINGSLVSTGTAVDIWTGQPWVYIELFVDKTASNAIVKCSGASECVSALPLGWAATGVEHWDSRATITSAASAIHFVDDIVVYSGETPKGILKVDGYFKDGDVLTGFSDGSDGGGATTAVNTTSAAAYRACATVGGEDRFSYTNILPTGIDVNDILAVIPSVVAASGSFQNGKLDLTFTSGASTTTTDVTSKVVPFTPQYIQGTVHELNPATGLPWTRAEAQAVRTGYKVKA